MFLFGADDGVAIVGFVCLGLIGLGVYFLPTLIAGMRGHRNGCAICVFNLLLGWTFVFWALALVWAFTQDHSSDESASGWECSHCGTPIASPRVRWCPGCGKQL